MELALYVGGTPAWWARQDDTMVATGMDVIEQATKGR